MPLTIDEQAWLEEYGRALTAQYPGVVTRLVLYGSKARGDDHPDSDIDVLVIVNNEAGDLKRPLRRLGYMLAAMSEVVPSILAYTYDEWEQRKASGASFQRAVERDAVAVL